MRYLVCIAILFSFSQASSQKLDLLSFRLNFRYEINTKFCLNLAQKKINAGSKSPKAFFYAIKINMDIAENQLSVTDSYLRLSSALSYARRYDRLIIKDSSTVKQRAELLQNLESQTKKLSKLLLEKGKDSKSARLANKLARVLKPIKKQNQDGSGTATSPAVITKFENGFYFGIPTGNEIIKAHNTQREKEVVRLLNIARKEKGLEPLVWEDGLAKAARYHAYDMASQNYFSHASYDRVDGKLVRVGGTFQRIRKFYSGSFVNSENIAGGAQGAYDTYMQWFHSEGHYKNMFNASSKRVGVGLVYDPKSVYTYYWVFCTAK
jgi:uncharacterized protein YkwD